LIWRII